jgi:membrane protein DedA with SNARE-associated domain
VSDATLPDPIGDPVALPSPHVRPRWAPLTLAAFVGLVICTNIANATWPKLTDVDSPNPELLLLLSSRNRYLAFALGSDVSIPAYIAIGFLRIMAAFLVCHLIGRAYSNDAIGWFKKYLGFNEEAERTFDAGFQKAEWALIPIFAGSNIVGVLTGVRRTPWTKLLPLLTIGIAGRMAMMWWLSRFFEDELDSFLEFTTRYQWWFLIGSVGLVVLVNLKNMRRR